VASGNGPRLRIPLRSGSLGVQDSIEATSAERAPIPDGRVWSVVLSILWVGLATYLQLNRIQGAPAGDTIWAEDGHIFLSDALHRNSVGLLWTGAGHYMHLVPRLLAALAAALPLRHAASVFAVGSALIVSLLSLYVFIASRSVISSTWGRAALAGLVVVLPAAGFESTSNAANLHYFLMFGAFWALLDRPRSGWGAGAGVAVVLGATMSDPHAALLAPVAVWSFLQSKETRHRLVPIAFGVGLLVQAIVVFQAVILGVDAYATQYPFRWSGSDVILLPPLYGLRVFGQLLVGEQLLDNAWRTMGWLFAALSLLLAMGLVVYAVLREGVRRSAPVLVLAAYSAVFFAVPVLTRGTEHIAPIGSDVNLVNGNRYLVVPMLFVLAVAIAVLERPDRWLPPRTWSGIRIAAGLVLSSVILTNFSVTSLRSAGPLWSTQVSAAERTCTTDRPGVVLIQTTPIVPGFVWNVRAPCDEV
jgi:hypothetical protein